MMMTTHGLAHNLLIDLSTHNMKCYKDWIPTSIQNKGWSKDGIGDRWLTGSGLLPHEDAAAHFPIGY